MQEIRIREAQMSTFSPPKRMIKAYYLQFYLTKNLHMNDNLALKIKKTVIPSQRESQNQHTYIKQFNEHNQRGSL